LDSNVVFFVGLCATVIVVLFFIICINLVGLLNCWSWCVYCMFV